MKMCLQRAIKAAARNADVRAKLRYAPVRPPGLPERARLSVQLGQSARWHGGFGEEASLMRRDSAGCSEA